MSKRERVPRAKTVLAILIGGKEYAVSDWNNTGCKIHTSGLGPIGKEISTVLILDSDESSYKIATKAIIRWEKGEFTGVQFHKLPESGNLIAAFKLREALGIIGKRTVKQEDITQFLPQDDKKAAQIVNIIKSRSNAFQKIFKNTRKKRYLYTMYTIGFLMIILGVRFLFDRANYIVFTGKVAGNELALNSNFKGSIVRLNASEGDIVQKGVPLILAIDEVELRENEAELENLTELVEQYKQQYSLISGTASHNELNSLKAQLNQAENTVKRYQYLFDQGAASEELLEEKKENYTSLSQQIAAKINKQTLYTELNNRYNKKVEASNNPFNSENVISDNLDRYINRYQNGLRIINSPATATIKSFPQPVGTPVSVGTTIAVLSGMDKPIIKAYVSPEQAILVETNTYVEIHLPHANKILHGKLSKIDLSGGYGYRISLDQYTENFNEDSYLLGDKPAELVVTVNPNQDFDLIKHHGLKVKLKIRKNR